MNRDDPYARVRAFIERKRLVARGQRVLVGTGGGAVSLGLVCFLVAERERLGLAEVAVASVETSVDETSDAAERVADVGRVVRQLGVTFHAVRPSSLHRGKVNVARELVALAREQGFDRVALGATRDDHVLAVLDEALSGRGLMHMRGIAPRVTGGIIRPLLCVSTGEALGLVHGIETIPQEPPDGRSGGGRREALRGVLARLRVVFPGVERALEGFGEEVRALRGRIRREALGRIEAGRRGDRWFEIPTLTVGRSAEDGWWWPPVAEAMARRLLRECGATGLGAEAERAAVKTLTRMLCGGSKGKSLTLLVSGVAANYVGGTDTVRVRGTSRNQGKRREAGG